MTLRSAAQPIAVLVVAVLATTSCGQPFEPIEEGLHNFSLFGFVNVSADTQWIRVMPRRLSINTFPDPIDANVTLEHLGTGETITLNDSLFSYQNHHLDAKRYAHNFWTAERIDFGATYRLIAQASDGASSVTVLKIPPQITRVGVGKIRPSANPLIGPVDFLRLEGVDNLVMVIGEDECGARRAMAVSPPWPDQEGYLVAIEDVRAVRECGLMLSATLVISGSPWPFDRNSSFEMITLPTVSNVEQGSGFVGGILTKTVPLQTGCTRNPLPPPREAYCEVTYDGGQLYSALVGLL